LFDQIVGTTMAYFIVHQYKDEDGKPDAEVLERLTTFDENEYDDAFDCLEYELKNHSFEDRYSVVKVESKLIKEYCWEYACYEYNEELYIEEVKFL
jgi:hypothetical protein